MTQPVSSAVLDARASRLLNDVALAGDIGLTLVKGSPRRKYSVA